MKEFLALSSLSLLLLDIFKKKDKLSSLHYLLVLCRVSDREN